MLVTEILSPTYITNIQEIETVRKQDEFINPFIRPPICSIIISICVIAIGLFLSVQADSRQKSLVKVYVRKVVFSSRTFDLYFIAIVRWETMKAWLLSEFCCCCIQCVGLVMQKDSKDIMGPWENDQVCKIMLHNMQCILMTNLRNCCWHLCVTDGRYENLCLDDVTKILTSTIFKKLTFLFRVITFF